MKLVQRQSGSTAVIAALVGTVLLLIIALGFGVWAYSGRQDYKTNVDQKVADAVTAAKLAESTRKDAEFAEISKSPLKTYLGPEAFGSIQLKYPKSWSGYVINSSDNSPYIDGYFSPGVVPDIEAESSTFALRIQVSSDSYSTLLENYSSGVEDGTVKVSPYKLPNSKVSKIVGSKIVGQLTDNKKGTLIIVPLRANALEIWTESDKYLHDFNKYILPNLTFRP
jgi:hypothetical protein